MIAIAEGRSSFFIERFAKNNSAVSFVHILEEQVMTERLLNSHTIHNVQYIHYLYEHWASSTRWRMMINGLMMPSGKQRLPKRKIH